MKKLEHILALGILLISQTIFAQTAQVVSDFNKVIISPYIETTFVRGNQNTVTILENTVSYDKVNTEVKNVSLYLGDDRVTVKNKKVIKNAVKVKVPIYINKVLIIEITYENNDNLKLKGKQRTICESLINTKEFKLKIYDESQVIFIKDINLNKFYNDIYG